MGGATVSLIAGVPPATRLGVSISLVLWVSALASAAIDNIPVLSYLVLGGRCRSCRAAISLRYPAIELFTGCVFAAIAWRLAAPARTACCSRT